MDEDLDAALDSLDIDNDYNLSILDKQAAGTLTLEDLQDDEDLQDGDDDEDEDEDDNKNKRKNKNKDNDKSDDDNDEVDSDNGSDSDSDNNKVSDNEKNEEALEEQWITRLGRDEVFSHRYRPSNIEAKEIKHLRKELGLENLRGSLMTDQALHKLTNNDNNNHHDGGSDHAGPYSIILKRGRIFMDGKKDEVELILLTHGFIVAKIKANSLFTIMAVPYETFGLCDHINWLRDVWQIQDKHQFSLSLSTNPAHKNKKQTLTFQAPSASSKHQWIKAWERVLMENRAHAPAEERDARDIGWQHELVQTSVYTAAVTGQAFFSDEHIQLVNTLDQYNGLGPLHYAAIYDRVQIIQHLVQNHEADVELEDGEGRTPIYYAQRDELEDSVKALRELGSKMSEALDREENSALAQGARAEEEKRRRKHRIKKHKKKHKNKKSSKEQQDRQKLFGWGNTSSDDDDDDGDDPRSSSFMDMANDSISRLAEETYQKPERSTGSAVEKAHANMGDAINAINERGEKIDRLANNTDKLEDGASEFKSMAQQMREKLEKEDKQLGRFLNPFSGFKMGGGKKK